MHIVERLWAGLTSIFSIVTLSPFQDGVGLQSPLRIPSDLTPYSSSPATEASSPIPDVVPVNDEGKGPRFPPPGGSKDYPFDCEYPSMHGWEKCSTPSDRKCWLRRISDGKQYDIFTNYEDDMPIGITRHYELELKNGSWDADGLNFPHAKLFNNDYPGPWIQACWGDT